MKFPASQPCGTNHNTTWKVGDFCSSHQCTCTSQVRTPDPLCAVGSSPRFPGARNQGKPWARTRGDCLVALGYSRGGLGFLSLEELRSVRHPDFHFSHQSLQPSTAWTIRSLPSAALHIKSGDFSTPGKVQRFLLTFTYTHRVAAANWGFKGQISFMIFSHPTALHTAAGPTLASCRRQQATSIPSLLQVRCQINSVKCTWRWHKAHLNQLNLTWTEFTFNLDFGQKPVSAISSQIATFLILRTTAKFYSHSLWKSIYILDN